MVIDKSWLCALSKMYVNIFASPHSEDDMRNSQMASKVTAWSNILMGISPRVWVIWTPPRDELPREAWFHLNTLWENPDVGIWTCPVTLNKWWVGALQNQNQTGTVPVCVDGCGWCASFFSSPFNWLTFNVKKLLLTQVSLTVVTQMEKN